MKSKVISCSVVLFAMSFVSRTNFVSIFSILLIVFTFNSFAVYLIAIKRKTVNELQSKLINYSVIYKLKKLFSELSELFSKLFQSYVNVDLSNAEKSLAKMQFCGSSLDIRNECKTVSQLITDNYMDFWYDSIGTNNKEFVFECRLILEKLFCNLFDRSVQKIDGQMFANKTLTLLESHLNQIRDNSFQELNEKHRMDSIIERVLLMTATEEIADVVPKESSDWQRYSIYLMIKAMLTHSVFIPIVDIIADKKFIYKNLVFLITNSDFKVADSEYHTESNLGIDEPFNRAFKDQIKSIDSIDCSHRQKSLAIHDRNQVNPLFGNSSHSEGIQRLFLNQNLMFTKQFSDNINASDISENESMDELIVEALEAEEEIDSKIISNLVISETKETKELFGAPYILYLIRYDGLFKQEVDFPDTEDSDQKFCLVRKTVSVYRRFSEFISLQKALERNNTFKRLMKGVKKPTAIQITTQNLFVFAGTSNTPLDASTVEFRRIYLQNFLQQLCNRKAILESPELHQFLAYGSDGSITFVNKSSDKILLNIDKMLFRGVKGAISIMKSALPVEAQVGKIDPQFSQRIIPETEKVSIRSISTKVDSESPLHLEYKINGWMKTREENKAKDIISKEIYIHFSDEPKLGARTLGDGCENPNDMDFCENALDIKSKVGSPVSQCSAVVSSPTNSAINCLILFVSTKIELIRQIITVKVLSLIFGTAIERFVTSFHSNLRTHLIWKTFSD